MRASETSFVLCARIYGFAENLATNSLTLIALVEETGGRRLISRSIRDIFYFS